MLKYFLIKHKPEVFKSTNSQCNWRAYKRWSALDHLEPEDDEKPARKRQKNAPASKSLHVIAKKVCDNILTEVRDMFDFKDHLSVANLFFSIYLKVTEIPFPKNILI